MLRWLQHNYLATILFTRRFGKRVGEDAAGNRYYEKPAPDDKWRESKRWVVYVDRPDPTTIPPGWYGWLHKRFKDLPSDAPDAQPFWQKERLPNLTGTPGAYLPPGDVRRGGDRAAATGDYEAWTPD